MVIMVRSRLGWKKLCRVDQKIEFFGILEVLFAGSVVHWPVIVVFLRAELLVVDRGVARGGT